MRSVLPFMLLMLQLLSTRILASEAPVVVTSIKPLQLIASEIMHGRGNAHLLIDSDQSPHHFQLRPSQLSLASAADLLIWVSNEFETGLQRLQALLPPSTYRLQLATSLPAELVIGEGHELDGHLWLAPENVAAISELMTRQLSVIDPDYQALYQDNSQRLIGRLISWQQQLRQQLDNAKPQYILDHQFLAYFERSFGLHHSGSLRNSHDHGASIRQLSQLHQQLTDAAPKCLLLSSLPPSKQAQQISQRYQLEIKLINTLGESSNPESIIDLLSDIGSALKQCH